MEVELRSELLGDAQREDLMLLSLCAFGGMGRHRILRDNPTAWNDWAESLPADLRDEVLLAWDESDRQAAVGAASERVAVISNGPSFVGSPIRLTPRGALTLLGRPLRILLENGRNDRAFVLAFADKATLDVLKRAEQNGWLVFETAGGIAEINVRLEDARTAAEQEIFRTMYLCDSDAREPDQPSPVAQNIEHAVADLSARLKQATGHFGRSLTWRAAENYAPPGSVLKWARNNFGENAWKLIRSAESADGRQLLTRGTGSPGSARRNLLAAIALKELSTRPEVRGFLDLKCGRASDGKVSTIDSVWDQLDPFQQSVLEDGFGRGFSPAFYAAQTGLQDATSEISDFLATILRRL